MSRRIVATEDTPRLTHEEGLVTLYLPGTSTPLFARLGSTDIRSFNAVFGRRQHAVKVHEEPRIVLDLGANVGFTTIDLALRFPSATIVAVEPEPDNAHVLRLNTATFTNVHVVEAAVWRTDGAVSLRDVGHGEWGFVTDASALGTTVRAISMDTLMAEFGVDEIDLLKMDIEGAEHDILRGDAQWLDRVRALYVELHATDRSNAAATRAALARHGLRRVCRRDENEYYERSRLRARRMPRALDVDPRKLAIGFAAAMPVAAWVAKALALQDFDYI